MTAAFLSSAPLLTFYLSSSFTPPALLLFTGPFQNLPQTPFRISPNLHHTYLNLAPVLQPALHTSARQSTNTRSDTNHTAPPRYAHRPSLLRLLLAGPLLQPSGLGVFFSAQFSSVAQSRPTLQPHGLQHARLPCPSPTPGEKLPEVTGTSRGNPGFYAVTRERPRESFFNPS